MIFAPFMQPKHQRSNKKKKKKRLEGIKKGHCLGSVPKWDQIQM
uniref:Uncharacterized protein n=1 Tax=Rhizophora mucronata TaxID=61149 RepID=A0A2P2JWA3_RHIMU